MPQSLVNNYIHITFSTKGRESLISNEIKDDLFEYLGGICRKLECNPLIVGGDKDHIHILCLLSRKIALMSLIEKLKINSSRWIKGKGQHLKNFYWQHGYGGFSVNPTEINVVINYIRNQEQHHKKKTFQEEYRAFLKKYNIPYDERYVWD